MKYIHVSNWNVWFNLSLQFGAGILNCFTSEFFFSVINYSGKLALTASLISEILLCPTCASIQFFSFRLNDILEHFLVLCFRYYRKIQNVRVVNMLFSGDIFICFFFFFLVTFCSDLPFATVPFKSLIRSTATYVHLNWHFKIYSS